MAKTLLAMILVRKGSPRASQDLMKNRHGGRRWGCVGLWRLAWAWFAAKDTLAFSVHLTVANMMISTQQFTVRPVFHSNITVEVKS
jgi:hypothetical protein